MHLKIAILVTLISLTCATPALARTWTDSSGKFSIEAELVEVRERDVRLKRGDGTIVTVPIARLSTEDKIYIKSFSERASQDRDPMRAGADLTAKIEAELQKNSQAEFIDTPLTDVVAFLSDVHKISVYLDRRSLDDVGIGTDTPINSDLKGVPLSTILDRILDPLELTWVVRFDVLMITSQESGERLLESRVYNVTRRVDPDTLVADLTKNIDPNSWADVGGPASIANLSSGMLIVAQTQQNHRKIQEHYKDLLQPVVSDTSRISAIPGTKLPLGYLAEQISIHFVETPLKDIVEYLSERYQTKITIDEKGLSDFGLDANAPVTIDASNVRLSSALSLVLMELDLTWVADEAGVTITTREAEESKITLASHTAVDLAAVGRPDELIEAITSTVDPDSWAEVGGPGQIRAGVRGTLDVRQSFWGHQQVARLLDDLVKAGRARNR